MIAGSSVRLIPPALFFLRWDLTHMIAYDKHLPPPPLALSSDKPKPTHDRVVFLRASHLSCPSPSFDCITHMIAYDKHPPPPPLALIAGSDQSTPPPPPPQLPNHTKRKRNNTTTVQHNTKQNETNLYMIASCSSVRPIFFVSSFSILPSIGSHTYDSIRPRPRPPSP